MSTLVLVFVAVAGAILLLRYLSEERIACNSCLAVVRKRSMTTLADGRLICKRCLNTAISSGIRRAIARIPGAQEHCAFALEPGDKRIGGQCALCSQKLQALDPVCVCGQSLSHLVCAQLVQRIGGRIEDKKQRAERILVVDDEEAFREIISSMLTSAGYQCLTVAGGFEALDLLKSGERFELLLSDILNSPMDGITLLERMKENFPDIPVVIMTAVRDVSVATACARSGADDYLEHPVNRERLLATVSRALERRKEAAKHTR